MRAWNIAVMGLAAWCVNCGVAAAQFNDWYTVAMAASHNATEQVQEILLRGGADPDIVDSTTGRTALDYAASFNNVAMAKLLLDHGAHVDARDGSGNTALHWAAGRGNLDVMRFLMANKAAVDAPNGQGITPLMSAASHTQPAAVKLLLASGADPKKQDYTGRDAFGWGAGKQAVLQALNAKR
jgi:ankyrin repeat protein